MCGPGVRSEVRSGLVLAEDDFDGVVISDPRSEPRLAWRVSDLDVDEAYPESAAGDLARKRAKFGSSLPFSRDMMGVTEGLRDMELMMQIYRSAGVKMDPAPVYAWKGGR